MRAKLIRIVCMDADGQFVGGMLTRKEVNARRYIERKTRKNYITVKTYE